MYWYRYYAQLVLEGISYLKPKHQAGSSTVGLDLGPSTIALVPQEGDARLLSFCNELKTDQHKKRRLQRKLTRQRRANNPQNYDAKGRVKKGHLRWKDSRGYKATCRRLASAERKLTAHRKSLHGQLAHEIVRSGNSITTEKLSYKAWQKQYGKSVGAHAPGMFIERLKRTVTRTGGILHEVPTRSTKLSQYCHGCGTYVKKPLWQRWHQCACGIGPVQRDLYSAFLAAHLDLRTFVPSIAQATWERAETRLRAAIEDVQQRANAGKLSPKHGCSPCRSASAQKSCQRYQELCFPMEDVEAMARWQDPPSEADGGVSDIDLDACPAHMQRMSEISAGIQSGKLRACDRETIGRARTCR